MKPFTKFSPILLLVPLLLFLFLKNPWADSDKTGNIIDPEEISRMWKDFSGRRKGKIIYADPPDMIILYLHNGIRKKIEGIEVEGGKGRRNRGKTPRPFWAPDGTFFVYRYSGNIFIADEYGKKRAIQNHKMDTSKETRWSIIELGGKNFIFGPSKSKKGIAVSVEDPAVSIDIFPFPVIDKHCELTGDGKFIVYNSSSDIYVAGLSEKDKGVKISFRQNCRPCASPENYAAWLPAPHYKYNIHSVRDGKFVKALKAPVNGEIYRLNWSNDEEFVVHMFGSRGNTRMHVRKISNGESLFVGNGWDPDLWVEKD